MERVPGYLDDGELAVVRPDGFTTATLDGSSILKTPSAILLTDESLDSGSFDHYMRKGIAEQPDAVRRTLSGRLEQRFHTTHLGVAELAPQ